MKYLFVSILILVVITQFSTTAAIQHKDDSNKGVVLASNDIFYKLLQEEDKLIVLFSEDQCKYCQQISETFALIATIHNQQIKYVKLDYSQETSNIYQQYGIEDAPRIRAFEGGQPLPYQFECLGSGNSIFTNLFKWIRRIYGQLSEWTGQDDHSHQLVVDCSTTVLLKMWEKISISQSWLDVYCGTQQFLGKNFAIVAEFGKSIQAWQLQSDNIQQLQSKINKLIKAYKYKYVLNWNVGTTQQIFFKKQNAFVLIVNNESLSRQVFSVFEGVKKTWYQHSQKYEPMIFVVSDLSKNTYETLKIKRYFTGMTTSSIKTYYYPIIGFLYNNEQLGTIQKIVMNISTNPTKINIEEWMERVHNQIVLKKQTAQNQEPLQTFFCQSSDSVSNQNVTHKRQMKQIKFQSHWEDLLDQQEIQQPFFVYFTWRNNYNLQKLEFELKKWWEQEQTDISDNQEIPNKIKLFTQAMNVVSLPQHPNLVVNFFPSIFHFNNKKQITKLQGVTDLEKIKQFISKQYQIHQDQYKNSE